MFLNLDQKDKNKIAAISENGEKLSYGELQNFIDEVKAMIGDIIPERSLVFSLCENTIGALCGYAAFLSNRIVPLLLNATLDEELLQYLLNTYQPNFLWIPSEMNENFQGKCILEKYGYMLITYSDKSVKLNENLALLLTTSGSIGSPKLVRQSYKNIEANAKSIVEYLEIDEKERAISMLPMPYTYGLSIIQSHLLTGATMLMTTASYAQRAFWDFFKREEATSIAGVPYTYEMLKKLRFFRMELPSLRYMTQAGGKLLPELHKEFAEYAKENGKRFYVMYGQTEATARMAYLPYDKSLEKYGSMGIAIPGGKFRLIDVDENEITEPFVTGELVYEGENVTLGYAECKEDLAKGDERNGILHTGDMAQMDEDGFFTIVGRKKRFLKIFGNRVNLDECERMLQSEFEGIECACVGKDDEMKIYVSGSCETDKIAAYIVGKTKLNPRAFKVFEIDEIPKNESGKKLYNKLSQ